MKLGDTVYSLVIYWTGHGCDRPSSWDVRAFKMLMADDKMAALVTIDGGRVAFRPKHTVFATAKEAQHFGEGFGRTELGATNAAESIGAFEDEMKTDGWRY